MKPSPYPTQPVLIIDDEAHILKSFEITLRTAGINHIVKCQDPRDTLSVISDRHPCVILLDLEMPHISGKKMLLKLAQEHPDIPVIIITGDNDIGTAVSCMKEGAYDYMVKPVEKSRLVSGIRRVVEFSILQDENRALKERILSDSLNHPEAFSGIITNNRAMISLFQYTESIAVSPQPVLITGETGVGKELMAKAVHAASNRTGECICVNAAGIDDNVFADTIFGHAKGAFTGADQERTGLVEKASGGTLVLDEIGDLDMNSQVKLLRLIQEGEYFPLGSDWAKNADTRIIVSTNHDLRVLKESRKFRKDLYFRLRTHHIHIPPLRERHGDVPLLLDHFLEEAAAALGKEPPAYPGELVTLLSNYPFPGNVRELRTMVFDALSTHKSKMLSTKRFQMHMDEDRAHTAADPPDADPPSHSFRITGTLPTLKEAARHLIAEAMRRTNNNQSMAARLLGISRQTLARHLTTDTK